jgi:excisionase family DNA binding protein
LTQKTYNSCMQTQQKYFDLRTLATYSGMGISTLRSHIRTGGLPAYKAGGKILVKRDDFDSWMESHRLNTDLDLNSLVDEVMQDLARA